MGTSTNMTVFKTQLLTTSALVTLLTLVALPS